jgi:hypothetical protein
MAEGLEELCGKISLIAGEKQGLKITEGEVAVTREKGKRCLIGWLWAGKHTNKEAFQTVLSQIWRTRRGVVFKEIQENLWLFEFEEEDDMMRVKKGRPWSFDRQILVLNDFDGSITPSKMDFTRSPFWIQVHDMPLLCMTKGIGTRIGESLGELVDVDIAGDGAGWGRCMRIRVILNVMQPLERGRALEVEGKTSWVSFRYEKLPQFCFNCGVLVHRERGCPMPKPTRLSAETGPKHWGTWLRAEEPRRKFVGGWTSRSSEENRQNREGSMFQGSGGGQQTNSLMKESSAYQGNPRLSSERINSFRMRNAAEATRKGKELCMETEGEYSIEKGKENKGEPAAEVEEKTGDNWSTSLTSNAERGGEIISAEWGPRKGDITATAQNISELKPNTAGCQGAGVEAKLKGGFVDLHGEITPMDFDPKWHRTNTMAETPTWDSARMEAQDANKAEPRMKTTDKSRKGINLKAWKRRARKDETTNCRGMGASQSVLRGKHYN